MSPSRLTASDSPPWSRGRSLPPAARPPRSARTRPLPAPASVGRPVDAVLPLERHARSRGGVGPPGRGVVGGGGEGVGRARGRGTRGGRTSARPADVRASGASLRMRTGPAPGARWESGRGGVAPARPRLPVSVLGPCVAGASASLDPRCAGPQPARHPEAGLARPSPPSQTVPGLFPKDRPPRTTLAAAWPGTAPGAWPRAPWGPLPGSLTWDPGGRWVGISGRGEKTSRGQHLGGPRVVDGTRIGEMDTRGGQRPKRPRGRGASRVRGELADCSSAGQQVSGVWAAP